MESLYILGPFNLEKGSDKYLLNQNRFNGAGIYFWTIKKNDNYYVNYIGISSKDMKNRFFGHVKSYLIGNYDICDQRKLDDLIIEKVYNVQDNFEIFFNNLEANLNQPIKNLMSFSYFFSPIEEEKKILELIESELITNIKKNESLKHFLSNYKLSRIKTDILDLQIEINSQVNIMGIPSQINL